VVVPTPEGSSSTIRVIAHGNSDVNVYVERVTLNGSPLATPYVTNRQLLSNPTLEFWMSPTPTNAYSSFSSPT